MTNESTETADGWGAVILAAGDGKRMLSARSKPLHHVAGKPMLSHVISAVKAGAACPITVVARPEQASSEEFVDVVGDSVRIAVQKTQRGTADALRSAGSKALSAERVLVLYADTPLIRPETISLLTRTSLDSDADVTFVTADPAPTPGLGRVVRDRSGGLVAIVEERDADAGTLKVSEVNSGWYAFSGRFLRDHLKAIRPAANGEYYLTDLVALAIGAGGTVATIAVDDPMEITGVNDRRQQAIAEAALQARFRQHWLSAGVTLVDPATTYFGADVDIAPDVTIHPNTHIRGESWLARDCEIGPNTVAENVVMGEGSTLVASYAQSAKIGANCTVGPFSRLRPGAELEDGVHVGNYAEIKNSHIGAGTRIGHFAYVGDADVGRHVNVGAGTVFVNYDGERKHRTTVGVGAFIGSGSMLVAPLTIGARALIGAGAVVTHDVAPDARVAGVPARLLKRATGAGNDGGGDE